jgi:hypothetical protein
MLSKIESLHAECVHVISAVETEERRDGWTIARSATKYYSFQATYSPTGGVPTLRNDSLAIKCPHCAAVGTLELQVVPAIVVEPEELTTDVRQVIMKRHMVEGLPWKTLSWEFSVQLMLYVLGAACFMIAIGYHFFVTEDRDGTILYIIGCVIFVVVAFSILLFYPIRCLKSWWALRFSRTALLIPVDFLPPSGCQLDKPIYRVPRVKRDRWPDDKHASSASDSVQLNGELAGLSCKLRGEATLEPRFLVFRSKSSEETTRLRRSPLH